MSVYRNRYAFIEGNGTILRNIEDNIHQNLKYRKKRHHFEEYRRKRCQNFMWRQIGNPIIINNKDRKRGSHHEKDY